MRSCASASPPRRVSDWSEEQLTPFSVLGIIRAGSERFSRCGSRSINRETSGKFEGRSQQSVRIDFGSEGLITCSSSRCNRSEKQLFHSNVLGIDTRSRHLRESSGTGEETDSV